MTALRKVLWGYVIILPFILFVVLERLNPASSAGLFSSGLPHMGSVLVSVLLIVLAVVAVYALAGSVLVAYGAVSLVLLVAYVVNYFKMAITGGVFVPSDIFLAGAAAEVAEPGIISVSFTLVSSILLVILLHIPLYFTAVKIKFVKRAVALPVVFLIIFLFFTGGFAANRVLPTLGLDIGTVTDRYRENGMMLGFYSELVSRSNAGALVFDTSVLMPLPQPQRDHSITPNVIVIMSESFVDPMTWGNINFSQYPVPNFRRLAEGNLSGNVIVPVFGGGTVNTEMEFLTGGAHVFYGSRFYVPNERVRHYFSREIPTALPWLFRENGYRTVAIHPFLGDFYNRNIIYPLIGFDEFIAQEQMPNATYNGPFISDEYFTDRIIEQIILAEESAEPLFLFGISMQNHWGFDPLKYGTLELDVMADSPYLNMYETQRVNSFLQGIFDADKQLGRLADFIESRDTPTIIVFFGDHLPILGRRQDRVFENLGFISYQEEFLWTLEDRANMFQTPYLVWANYGLGQECWGTVSTFLFGALVADAAGVNLNRYFTYVLQSTQHFRGITNELYLGLDGVFQHGWEYRNRSYILALEALWYANMFGSDDFHRSLAELIE